MASKVECTHAEWEKTLLNLNASIKDAIRCLDISALRIVLVVNEGGKLVGTVSDGDIRRGILKGVGLDRPITEIMRKNALVVPRSISSELILQIMHSNKLLQIPIVDDQQQVVGLHVWNEIASPIARGNPILIMAGGMGTRLMPYTQNCPKPMVHIAGKPMLQHIIERAKDEGFDNFILAINHLGHIIEEYFDDGSCLGVRIEYIKEKTPLGTAGALSLLGSKLSMPVLVTNGDVITDIRYGELLDFHSRHLASATMAVRAHEWQNPFGIVQTDGVNIIGFEEKPVIKSHINAGVYVLSPEALDLLKFNEPFDMPELFEKARIQKLRIVAYPMHEPWLDVGRPDDLTAANIIINDLR